MAAVKRRDKRAPHLDAHITPVERALLVRAAELETGQNYGQSEMADGTVTFDSRTRSEAEPSAKWLAAEFRALAEELHWW